ncbi:MAG: GIY-YIG nuclease family protein [Aliivibrio sp.]|nr:GIY-YIG nuclease family protein [Aliivibrio sp.]
MQQRIYIMESNGAIKVGISRDVEKRLSTLQCGSSNKITVIYKTNFCDNPEAVEAVCHTSMRTGHIHGEWFDIDLELAKNIVSSTFNAIAINASQIESASGKITEDAIYGMFDLVEVRSCMFKATDIVVIANKYRESLGMPQKQIASFFNTELSKNLITQSCLSRKVPVELVKRTARGNLGGTYVDDFLACSIVEWATGVRVAGMSSIINQEIK